jgi:predicted RNA-binding Zn-ribbon protein involved in translation (DUF1610 family)
VMRASPGDWIIKGIKGEFYPCKPEIFTATYDNVADTPRLQDAKKEMLRAGRVPARGKDGRDEGTEGTESEGGMKTIGDQYRAECPVCGKMIWDLWDLGNSLQSGTVISCDSCGAEIVIEDVNIVAELTLIPKAEKSKESGGQ